MIRIVRLQDHKQLAAPDATPVIYLFGLLVEIINSDSFSIAKATPRIQTVGDLLECFLKQYGKVLSEAYGTSVDNVRNCLKIIINGNICNSDSLVRSTDEVIIFYPAEGAS